MAAAAGNAQRVTREVPPRRRAAVMLILYSKSWVCDSLAVLQRLTVEDCVWVASGMIPNL